MLAVSETDRSLIAKDPIDWFEFSTICRPNPGCPSEGEQTWALNGYIHPPAGEGTPECCVVTVTGFSILPNIVAEKTGHGIFEVYDAPSQETCDAFSAFYDPKSEGLTSRVAKLIGIDRQTRTDFAQNVPHRHVHIQSIDFAAGFESAYDLMQVLDAILLQFLPAAPTPWVLITIDPSAFSDAATGARPEGQRMKAINAILKECGFAALGEAWVYRSGSLDHGVALRERLGQESPTEIARKPL